MESTQQERRIYGEIAALENMERAELLERWKALYGIPPFKGARQVTLIRAIVYKLQCKRHGELGKVLSRQLLKIATSELSTKMVDDTNRPIVKLSPKIKLGSRLIREWNGRTYIVSVTDKGFEMSGMTYTSLSAAAQAITGTRWSGPRFFGVRS